MFGAWSALLGLAVARSRRRAGSLLAIAAGVAVATAVVLSAAPLTLVARQASMERALSGASPADRSLRLTVLRAGKHDGGPAQLAQLDTAAADGLRGAGLAPGSERAVRFSGRVVGRSGAIVLAGVDGLEQRVRMTSGRLPRTCTKAACEVVAVTGERVPEVLRVQGARVRVVGRGRLDAVPLGSLPPPEGRLDSGATFLVADGVAPLLALKTLDGLPRSVVYTRVIDPAAVRPWTADRVLAGFGGVVDAFTGIVEGARVELPAAVIATEAARGRAAAAFALIIAGLAATVLLAFAAFAATEQHDDVAAELTRLRAMAARRRHLAALVVGEATVPALAGVVAGAALATAIAAAAAAVALDGGTAAAAGAAGGAGVADILREGLFTSGSLTVVLALLAASVVVVAGVLGGAQSRTVRIALEAGCVVALAALAWQAASRGRLDAGELASGGAVDPVLVLAPGAAALACGLLALRVVPVLLRALARAAERLPVGPYLALVGLARQPGRTAAAVAVVAVAATAGTFALGHARTLQEGALDQAAYRTAADVRGLAPAPGVTPTAGDTPVVRIRADTFGRPLELQMIGIGAGALPRLPGWRADFSATPIAVLAQRLDGDPGGVRLQGVEIPLDARRIDLPVRIKGARVLLQLAIQRPDGTFARLLEPRELRPGRHRLSGPVGPRERGGRAVAFEVSLAPGGSGSSAIGEVEPGPLRARLQDGRRVVLTDFDDWISATDGSFNAYGGPRVFSYSTAGAQGYLAIRPQQPAAREPIPVLATPGIVARAQGGGSLLVRVPGGGQARLQVVGRVEQVPTSGGGETVIADVGRLFAALNTQYPGLGAMSERWRIGPAAPSGSRELRLDTLAAAAADDPLARGVLLGLRVLALLGALVALASIVLAVAATARDRGGEQAELEAIGVPPRKLRAQMVAGAIATAAVGLLAGLLGGAALTGLFTDLLALGADGRRPLPDLLPAFPWPLATAAIVAAGLAATFAAAVQARRAFRGDSLGRLRG